MLAVTTPAATTALTTLANVKLSFDYPAAITDPWVERQIEAISLIACEVMGVEMAEDGSRHFGVEGVAETFDRRSRYPWLPPFGIIVPRREADTFILLSRKPVISIASVTENGVAVDPSDYELFATTGKLKRLSGNVAAAWPCAIIVVNYTAGWNLPGDDEPNMPSPIEEAVIEGIQAKVLARNRDQNIRSENIPGIREVQYFFGSPGQDQPLPPSAMAKLNPYRVGLGV